MTKLPEIASLWIGGKLSWLEQLCLKSFADAGHHTTIYSYEPLPNVPKGVHEADANDIFPGEPMLRHAKNGSPAIHADMWRLNLLKKTDKIWVDADMYCYRPFDYSSPFVYGWEKPGQVCNAVLGLPRDSKTLTALLDFFSDPYAIAPWLKPWQIRELTEAREAGHPVHITEQKWGFTGPASVTHFLIETGEVEHALPEPAFYPVDFRARNSMIWDGRDVKSKLTDETRGVHFWARRLKARMEEKEGGVPHPNSFLAGLLRKHDIDPAAAPIPKRPAPPVADPGQQPRIATPTFDAETNALTGDPALLARIGLAALQEGQSFGDVAKKFKVDRKLVRACRDRVREGASQLFSDSASS